MIYIILTKQIARFKFFKNSKIQKLNLCDGLSHCWSKFRRGGRGRYRSCVV